MPVGGEFLGLEVAWGRARAGPRIAQHKAAHDPLFDVTFVRTENANGQVQRQPFGKVLGMQLLEAPDGGLQRSAFDPTAIGPFITDIDSLASIVARAIFEAQLAILRPARVKLPAWTLHD